MLKREYCKIYIAISVVLDGSSVYQRNGGQRPPADLVDSYAFGDQIWWIREADPEIPDAFGDQIRDDPRSGSMILDAFANQS